MKEPLISLILPIYNVSAYLDRCIQSIFHQGFSDYEVILVDDGSTDDSPRLCDAYAADNPFVSVVHKTNDGLSSARNAGISVARGQYVYCIDPDDYLKEDALQCIAEATHQKADIVKISYVRHEDGAEIPVSGGLKDGYYSESDMDSIVRQSLSTERRFEYSAWTHIFRRDFLEKNHLRFVSEREIGSEDIHFTIVAYALARSLVVLDKNLYAYDVRSGSLTQRYRNRLFEQYAKLFDMLEAFFESKNILERYRQDLYGFYIWKLVFSTWIGHEYRAVHMQREGRRRVRECLRSSHLCGVMKEYDSSSLSIKRRIIYIWMKLDIEPLLYWLYTRKI